MKVAFVSNFLSSHQLPICDTLSCMSDVEFRFISTTPISQIRKQMGWTDLNNTSYVIKAYKDAEGELDALEFVSSADVVIFGHDKADIFFKNAVKNKSTVIYRCSERLYKHGRWRVLSPRGLWNRWNTYFRYPIKNQYLLCASAYAAKDYALLGAFCGKSFKWGYFPPNKHYDLERHILKKKEKSIFWAGRMITLKHPEIAVEIAKRLKYDHIEFNMRMAGDGPLIQNLKDRIKDGGLEENIQILGNCSQEEVRQYMAESQIFLATSDYQEGWGAVVNEAMAEGCAVVGCEAMGAVPYLIQSGENGYSFGLGEIDTAYEQIKQLLENGDLCCNIMKSAYLTIQNEWNANCAAHRLISLSSALLSGNSCSFSSGPCSKAELL